MTRICLLVEVDLTPDGVNTPNAARQEVDYVLGSQMRWANPTVQLTAHEPAEDPIPVQLVQHLKDMYKRPLPIGSDEPATTADAWADWLSECEWDDYLADEERLNAQAAWNEHNRAVNLNLPDPEIYEITTDNSRYRIVLNANATGSITRLGGSSPYVPPDIARKRWDGVAYYFTDGRFEQTIWDVEVFMCNGHIRRTSPIREKKLVS